MRKLTLFDDALPADMFKALSVAIRLVGSEGTRDNGSYDTTFWYPRWQRANHPVEQAIDALYLLADPPDSCTGTEWWLGRLGRNKPLGFHYDRDLSLHRTTGQVRHPAWSSILYINSFSASPTVVLDQTPSTGQTSPKSDAVGRWTILPVPNRYIVFQGNLRHGVECDPLALATSEKLRLSLLVNFWDERPRLPTCRNFDGAIYGALTSAV